VGGVSVPLDYIPQPPGSRALDAGQWFAEAVRLEAESRELRRMLVVLLVWVAEREELLAFFHAEAARRWPDAREAA
jgi:hypothetical protein